MSLETVFSKSWLDIKTNWKLSLKISLWLFVIPLLVILLFVSMPLANLITDTVKTAGASMFFNATNSSQAGPITGNVIGASAGSFFLIFFILLFVLVILLCISQLAVLYISIYNEKGKMKTGEATRKSLAFFWRIVGFVLLLYVIFVGIAVGGFIIGAFFFLVNKILFVIALILLIIGYIVLCIWLGVKWYLAFLIIVREDRGIVESMRLSSTLVSGRWWKTFGCILLFSLIVSGLSFAVSLIIQMFYFMFLFLTIAAAFAGPVALAVAIFFMGAIAAVLYGFFMSIGALVFFVLMKNFYLELRTGKMK